MMRERKHSESAAIIANPMPSSTITMSQADSTSNLRNPRDGRAGIHIYESENPKVMRQGARTIEYTVPGSTLSIQKTSEHTGPSIETDERAKFSLHENSYP